MRLFASRADKTLEGIELMRTLTRRGLMAGAVSVFAPLAGSRIVSADDSQPGEESSVRLRSDQSTGETADTSPLTVEARVEAAPDAAETQLALGQSIANFALSYVGYPYVAGGNSPAGFDCSGFTQFVMLNMLGIDIGHAVEGQPGSGAWIDWGSWIPGDVIFFQNTYRPGISHAAIYIGDNLFVHAENEGTGVVVTNIYADYYLARYWGAIRLI